MPNRANNIMFGEKGHWHKGHAGTEIDKLGRSRYVQIMTAVEYAKKSLADQMSANYVQQNRPNTTPVEISANQHKAAVEAARSSVKQAIETKAEPARS